MAEKMEVISKQVIFENYITGFPKESDMYVSSDSTLKLSVEDGAESVLVKNLYLSCDPYMSMRMKKVVAPTPFPDFPPFTLGSVSMYHSPLVFVTLSIPYFMPTRIGCHLYKLYAMHSF